MDTLIHFIYASTATRHFDRRELVALLDKARAENARLGLTGILLYEADNFFQVLEGPESAIIQLTRKIWVDPRHDHVVKIIEEPIVRRSFTGWTMAFSEITRLELASIEGLNDFFEQGSIFAQLGSGRAKKLVAAFKNGRWRRKMTEHAEPASA